MVDSREKGARAESQAKDLLRKTTGLDWQRVPGSGALDARHGLKGDLYIPNANNVFCVEVKHYKDDHLDSSILTGKSPQLIDWWEQTLRESAQVGKHPMLLFKHDRSKWFMCVKSCDFVDYLDCERYIEFKFNEYTVAIFKFEEWLDMYSKNTKWIVK